MLPNLPLCILYQAFEVITKLGSNERWTVGTHTGLDIDIPDGMIHDNVRSAIH